MTTQSIIDELKKTARDADRIDKDRAEVLALLIKTEGWKVYSELIMTRIQGCADEILAPAKGIDDLVARENIKGTMSGLLLAVGLPSAIIQGMKKSPDDGESE